MTKLDSKSTVARWISTFPKTAQVFASLRIDFPVGDRVALAEICELRHMQPDTVAARLKECITTSPSTSAEDWSGADLANLCDHIEITHHAYLGHELPRLSGLIETTVNTHGHRFPSLAIVQSVFGKLRDEKESHMRLEEQVLFPAIWQLVYASDSPQFPFWTVANPIRMMEHGHEVAGDAMKQIRELTANFQPPEGACDTYCAMLNSLQRLEEDLHHHLYKENNILFPGAQALETRLSTFGAF